MYLYIERYLNSKNITAQEKKHNKIYAQLVQLI